MAQDSDDGVSYEEVGGNSLSSDSFATYSAHGPPSDRVIKDFRQSQGQELVLHQDSRSSLTPGSGRLESWRAVVIFATAFFAYFGPFVAVFWQKSFDFIALLQLLLDVLFTANLVVRFNIAHRHWNNPNDGKPWPFVRIFGMVPLSVLSGPVPGILDFRVSQDAHYIGLLLFLRLLRMQELTRFDVLKRRLYQLCGLPQSAMEVAKCLFVTSVAAHWVACAMCALSQEGEGKGYLLASVVGIKAGPCSGDDLHSDPLCFYSLGLYWSMMTLTGAGYYGDMAPQSPPEHRMCIICMFVMGYVWVFNAGKVFGLLQPSSPERRGSSSAPASRVTSRKQFQLESQMSRLLEKNVELEAKIDRMLGELYAGKKLVRTE